MCFCFRRCEHHLLSALQIACVNAAFDLSKTFLILESEGRVIFSPVSEYLQVPFLFSIMILFI